MICPICKDALWLPVAVRSRKTGKPRRASALCKCRAAQERKERLEEGGNKIRSYFLLPMNIIVPAAVEWRQVNDFAREREERLWKEYREQLYKEGGDLGGEEKELPF